MRASHGNVMEQLTMEEPLRLTDTLSVSVSRRNPWVPLSMSSKIDLGYVERRAGSRRPPRRVDLSHRQGPSQHRPTLWHREAGEGRTRASIGRKAAGSASPGAYSGDREHSVRRRRGPKVATLLVRAPITQLDSTLILGPPRLVLTDPGDHEKVSISLGWQPRTDRRQTRLVVRSESHTGSNPNLHGADSPRLIEVFDGLLSHRMKRTPRRYFRGWASLPEPHSHRRVLAVLAFLRSST